MQVFKLRTFRSRQFSVIRIKFKNDQMYIIYVTDQLKFYTSSIDFTYIPVVKLEM